MRKCEQAMIDAVRAVAYKRSFKTNVGGNTTVTVIHHTGNESVIEVRLHGHLIAELKVRHSNPEVIAFRWTLAGYNTVTTRSRVNALCRAFGAGHAGVCQRRHDPVAVYPSGQAVGIGAYEWVNALGNTACRAV